MPPFSSIPSARFRRIGNELRRIREEAGLTIMDAVPLLERSSSSISLIETGLQSIRVRDLEYMLLKYGVPDGSLKDALLELARDGRKKGWWRQHAKVVPPDFMDFLSLEADARSIRTFQNSLVPGLLQTADYATAHIDTDDETAKKTGVQIRMTRQAVLTKTDPPRYHAVVGEAVLRQEVGGREIMQAQRQRLLDLAALEHLELQVIPFSAGSHRGLDGPFTMLEVGERGRLCVVTLEDFSGISYVEDTAQVRKFAEVFDELVQIALSAADSRVLLERLMSDT